MRKQWRCFFCDEVFTRRKDAAEHFGRDDACEAEEGYAKGLKDGRALGPVQVEP